MTPSRPMKPSRLRLRFASLGFSVSVFIAGLMLLIASAVPQIAIAKPVEGQGLTGAAQAPALLPSPMPRLGLGLGSGLGLNDRPASSRPAYSPMPRIRLAQKLSAKEAYEFAREVDSVDGWESFLRQYPTGFLSDLARSRLRKLPGGASSAAADPVDEQPGPSGGAQLAGNNGGSGVGDAGEDDTAGLLDPSDPAGLFDVRRGSRPDTETRELTSAGEDPYLSFEFAEDDFYICLEACAEDAQCKSWSYTPPSLDDGSNAAAGSARCELATFEAETAEDADCPDCVIGVRLEDGEAPVPLLESEVKDEEDAEITLALGAVSACPRGLRLDGDECVSACESGERLVRGQCRSLCGEGTFWDGQFCVAEQPRCEDGSSWSNGRCRSICSSGSAWNGLRCVASRPQCGPNYRRSGNRCVWRCDINEVSIDGVCSRVDCGPGRTMRYGSCIRYRPDFVRFSCPRGMRWNGEACEYSCGLGRDYDYISGRCLWIPYNGFCGRGYRMTDSGLCAPRQVSSIFGYTCPFGLRRSGGLCVSIFVSGSVNRSCARGWQWSNGTCRRFCPAGLRFDPNTGGCRQVARNGICGVGLQIGPLGLCLPVRVARNCQPGFAFRNGRCRAVAAFCPGNFRRVNGRCVPIALTVVGRPGCPAGTRIARNGRCVPLNTLRVKVLKTRPVGVATVRQCPAGTRSAGANRCAGPNRVCSFGGGKWNCVARNAPGVNVRGVNAPAGTKSAQTGRTVCRTGGTVDFSKCNCPAGWIANSTGGSTGNCVKDRVCPLNKAVSSGCSYPNDPKIVCVGGAPVPGGGTICHVRGSAQHKAFVKRALNQQNPTAPGAIPPPIVKQVRTACPAGTRPSGNNRCTSLTQVCTLANGNWNCVARKPATVSKPPVNTVVTCAVGQRRVGNRCVPINANRPPKTVVKKPPANNVLRCAAGQRRVGNRCVAVNTNRPPKTVVKKPPANNVLRCAAGQRRVGNRCVAVNTNRPPKPAVKKPPANTVVRCAAGQRRVGNRCVAANAKRPAKTVVKKPPVKKVVVKKAPAKPVVRCAKGQRVINGRCVAARAKPAPGSNVP